MTEARNDVLARGLLACVILSSVIQVPFIWDLDGHLSNLNSFARNWNFASLIALFLFSWMMMFRQLRAPRSVLPRLQAVLLCAVAGFVLVRTLVHSDFGIGLFGLGWLLNISFLWALFVYAVDGGLEGDEAWCWLGLAAVLHLAAFLLALVMLWDVSEYPWIALPPGFNNIRHLGYLMAAAAAASGMIYTCRHGTVFWPLVSFAAALFYLFLTGSRGGVMAVFVGLPVVWAIMFWRHAPPRRWRVLVLSGFAGGLLLLVYLLPPMPFDTILLRAEKLNVAEDASGGMRLTLWRITAGVIADNWLVGVGPVPVALLPEVPERFALNHTHNVVLQIFLHWGVLGAALIALTAGSMFRPVLSIGTEQLLQRMPAVAVMCTMLVHASVDGSLFYPFTVAIFLIAFAQLVRGSGPATP
ncbi:MAG: O-antigen ligase family protein [Paracoccaceae bacterium]